MADVAEVPTLAPDVRLSEEMEESAFVDPQWLAQRDGKFVQLTELLYRVLAEIDGKRNLEQIAEAVGDAIDRDVTADNVRQLISLKLIPLGLVTKADGSVLRPSGEAEGAARSPLQVNLKMAMLSPRTIRWLTAPLTFLYWPPVVAVAVVAIVVSQGWLYLVHGVGPGVRDALYRPGLLLVVLGIVLVATAFHELGHAAALRYGGGQVRGMGAGIYIIYPAFYTDVTDNYRLNRLGRVRTDLGGIYFNLIFSAAMTGLYVLTGAEFLLVSVVVLNLQTVQQLLPLVRLDGYWLLADLTGIPDFFSHMGAFLRSVLPIKWEGRKLPELKWWAKAVFAGYVLVVVPLLALLVFLAIKSFPRLAATTWDSFGQQFGALAEAWRTTDVIGLLAALVSIVALALPTLGLLYMLYILGRAGVTLLWRWSEGSVPRRVAAVGATAATALLLIYLWAPQLPTAEPGAPVYAAAGSAYQPIGPEERGTVGDALPGLVPLQPFVYPNTVASPTPPAASPTAEVAVPAAAQSPAAATPAASPSPTDATPVASPSVGASPAASSAAVPSPTADTTPTPTADTTPAPTEATTPIVRTAPTAAPPAPATGSSPPTPRPTGGTAPGTAPAPAQPTPTAPPASAPAPAPTTAPTSAPTAAPTSPPTTAAPTAPPSSPTAAVRSAPATTVTP